MAEPLARMVRDGVVQREPNPDDKRRALISLTRRSRARLSKATAALVEANREAMLDVRDEEQVLLRRPLGRVVKNIESQSVSELPHNPLQPVSDAPGSAVHGKDFTARRPA